MNTASIAFLCLAACLSGCNAGAADESSDSSVGADAGPDADSGLLWGGDCACDVRNPFPACPSSIVPGAPCSSSDLPFCYAEFVVDAAACGPSGSGWLTCCSGVWTFTDTPEPDDAGAVCLVLADAGHACSSPPVAGTPCSADGDTCVGLCNDALTCCSGTWTHGTCTPLDAGGD